MTLLIVCLRASGKDARWLEESILSSDIRAEILASDIWELAFYSSNGVFVNSDLFAQSASYSHVLSSLLIEGHVLSLPDFMFLRASPRWIAIYLLTKDVQAFLSSFLPGPEERYSSLQEREGL